MCCFANVDGIAVEAKEVVDVIAADDAVSATVEVNAVAVCCVIAEDEVVAQFCIASVDVDPIACESEV